MKRRLKKKTTPERIGALKMISRACVAVFFSVHVAAMCWWLVPANGYPRDHRSAELPTWITDIEGATFEWKRNSYAKFWAPLLEQYVFATATWQKWWLFAPNPMQIHDWITVKAVIDWKQPDQVRGLANFKTEVWGDNRIPVYDENPLYTSYEGKLEARMRGTAGRYLHDPKLVENLASGNWDRPLASFAEFFGRVYRARKGSKPLGIHVILTRGRIPSPFAERAPAAAPPEQRVLWYLHY